MMIKFITACGATQMLDIPVRRLEELPKFWTVPLHKEPETALSDGTTIPACITQERVFKLETEFRVAPKGSAVPNPPLMRKVYREVLDGR